MTSSKSWVCDGIPKDGKEYSGLGGPHPPCENYAPDCEECGLPRESSLPRRQIIPIKTAIVASVAVIIAIVSGGAFYTLVAKGCDSGLEKIDGQCIDPFLQPYQDATKQGEEALRIANNYQNIADLETAEPILKSALTQLSAIPDEALVYPEVAKKLEEYDKKRQEISSNISIEKAAQEKLKEVETIAKVATGQTEIAETIPQLKSAKQKWQEAQDKLQEVTNTRLVSNKVQQHRSQHNQQIALIDEEISRIEEENRTRNVPTTTYVQPKVKPKTYNTPPQKVLTPPRNKPIPRKVNPRSNQKNIPYDPCAVKNPPPNCLF